MAHIHTHRLLVLLLLILSPSTPPNTVGCTRSPGLGLATYHAGCGVTSYVRHAGLKWTRVVMAMAAAQAVAVAVGIIIQSSPKTVITAKTTTKTTRGPPAHRRLAPAVHHRHHHTCHNTYRVSTERTVGTSTRTSEGSR